MMKATAKCHVNIGGVWYSEGDTFDVADTDGLENFCEITEETADEEKPKRGRKKKD